jgi:heme-degrading monooxygenase HmoA
MLKMTEWDERVSIRDQLSENEGPVVLVNRFTVAPAEADLLLAAWTDDAGYFKHRPGFISTQLHRGIGGSPVFLNYAIWESVERFRTAFSNPEFRAKLENYPASTVAAPHLFRKLAVENICVA